MARKPKGDRAMTGAERAKQYRERKKDQQVPPTHEENLRRKLANLVSYYCAMMGPERVLATLEGIDPGSHSGYLDRLMLEVWRTTAEGRAAATEREVRERADPVHAGQMIAELCRAVSG